MHLSLKRWWKKRPGFNYLVGHWLTTNITIAINQRLRIYSSLITSAIWSGRALSLGTNVTTSDNFRAGFTTSVTTSSCRLYLKWYQIFVQVIIFVRMYSQSLYGLPFRGLSIHEQRTESILFCCKKESWYFFLSKKSQSIFLLWNCNHCFLNKNQ